VDLRPKDSIQLRRPQGFSTIRQATGNTVAGTGGQVTAAAAAAAITVAFGVFVLALVSFLGGDFALPALFSTITGNPLNGIPTKVLWCLDKVFPLVTMITALSLRVTFRFWAVHCFAISAAVIRWLIM